MLSNAGKTDQDLHYGPILAISSSNSWAGILLHLGNFHICTVSGVSICLVRSDICCNGSAESVVSTGLDHSLGTGLWPIVYSREAGFLYIHVVFLSMSICATVYTSFSGGNQGWRFTARIQVALQSPTQMAKVDGRYLFW